MTVYPSVTEDNTSKSTVTSPQKDLVGEVDLDGPNCEILEGKLGKTPAGDGPGVELDPQELVNGQPMEPMEGTKETLLGTAVGLPANGNEEPVPPHWFLTK